MKKLFVIVCDILAVAAFIALGAGVAWIGFTLLGCQYAAAMAGRIVAIGAIVFAVFFVASFIVWKCGGAPEGVLEPQDDDQEEEGQE